MPAEDRDRLFEKALARHLRGGADGGDSACPDAETLAAFREGILSVEEISAAKKHFAWCARCQEILVQLEATQVVSELRNQEDELVVGGAISDPKNGQVYGEASAPSIATRTPKEKGSRVTHFPRKKKWLLRWAAPAGAIAAGLLLYLSFRDFRSPAKHAEPATQIAENREDNSNARDSYSVPGVPEKAPQTPPPAAPKQKDDDLGARVSRQQTAKPTPSVLLDERERLRSKAEPPKGSKAEKKPAQPPPSTPKTAANANPAQSGGRISTVEPGTNPGKPKSFDAAAKSGVAGPLQNGAEAQQSQIQLQASGAATGAPAASPSSPVSPPPPPASASQQIAVTAAAPVMANETVEVSALNKKEANLPVTSRNLIDLAMLPARMVVASNEKSIWRFGERGAIAHSSDGGKTWKSQEVPVTATLTSGSAPAKNICWIAGAAGTLLRTTDGGKHWQLIIAPIAGDLGGVMASDGKHATIWDVSRQATYQTSNGGKNWEKKTAE